MGSWVAACLSPAMRRFATPRQLTDGERLNPPNRNPLRSPRLAPPEQPAFKNGLAQKYPPYPSISRAWYGPRAGPRAWPHKRPSRKKGKFSAASPPEEHAPRNPGPPWCWHGLTLFLARVLDDEVQLSKFKNLSIRQALAVQGKPPNQAQSSCPEGNWGDLKFSKIRERP